VSRTQQVDPMPEPILSFWKVSVSLAFSRDPKRWQGRGPYLGVRERKDLGCSPVQEALISWDERASASSSGAGWGQEQG
jgi:hypothetical protein